MQRQIPERRLMTTDRAHSVLFWRTQHSLISMQELAKAVSPAPRSLEKIIGIGLIEPVMRNECGPLFPRICLKRLQRVVRLRRDLGINLPGIAAVLDMRERIENLQREFERLRGRLRRVE
jgi:chaperone modulatory protein CbpM